MSNVLRSRCPTSGPDAGKPEAPTTSSSSPQRTFMSLPTEIHLAISKFLIYPDALSLKHTNAHFYSLVDTGINLKVEWLVERRSLHLECPNDRRCDLGSDLRFCRGTYLCDGDENMLNVNLDQALGVSSLGQKDAPIAQC
ncbi:F-box domain-containing protein [Fusarium austroafricanum]|uniref:F-box domain-containing protein n=1 Tax=Fusarium austroafricanum TaxID=2364996 RepID=A0A8H4NUJ5_9HYPO|nr:F-box domain-containing protein [Fusarium austroafricanum]